jgi:hypothetical protein
MREKPAMPSLEKISGFCRTERMSSARVSSQLPLGCMKFGALNSTRGPVESFARRE